MARFVALIGLLLVGGCFSLQTGESDKVALVSNNPFGAEPPPAATTKANYSPASQEISLRVDKIGRDLLAANPHIGLKPLFGTIGVEQPEVFHVQTKMVYVTKGLVDQCRSNPELAAVLSAELGKMVAEREALVGPEVRSPAQRPPIQLPMGNGAQSRESDFTALAELGRFEMNNPKTPRTLQRPDPMKLARGYLEKAGYQSTDLDAVQPILQEADKNIALERHFKGAQPQSPWAP